MSRLPRLPRRLALSTLVLLLAATASAHAATSSLQAERLAISPGAGAVVADAGAGGGQHLLLWSNGSATGTLTTTAGRRLLVRARGDQCNGAPRMSVSIDGRSLLTASVGATTWTDYGVDVGVANASHTLKAAFENDANGGGCDRNLRVDVVTVRSLAANPFASSRLWVEPDSSAARQAAAWRATRPADAAIMDRLAAEPQAHWLTGAESDITQTVRGLVDRAAAAGAIATLVAYHIPQRDCGSYSAGGAGSADAYRSWIRGVAAGIGDRRAAVLLEPDALAGMDCLSLADRDRRVSLVRDAVSVLTAKVRTIVYLDAGHPSWQPLDTIADRLRRAGVADAQGFTLNVSNFTWKTDNVSFAQSLSTRLEGAHATIDTSRNGLGPAPDGAWCNPPGRALGDRPAAPAWHPVVDAKLWVKRPGESDGTCNGGPAAGTWWPEQALELAHNAGW